MQRRPGTDPPRLVDILHAPPRRPTPVSGVSERMAAEDPKVILGAVEDLRKELLERDEKWREEIRQRDADAKAKNDGIRRELQSLRRSHVRHKDIASLSSAVGDQAAAIVGLDIRVGNLTEAIGEPPAWLKRASAVHDYTPEQLAELERGKGLWGYVGRLIAAHVRTSQALAKALTRRASLASLASGAAGSAPTWAPWLIDALAKAFGG